MTHPNKNILLYDGHCPFCVAQVERLRALHIPSLEIKSFQEKGALNGYPGLSYEACMKEIKLVSEDGKIMGGAQAIFYALSLKPVFRPLRWVYPLPLFRQSLEAAYAFAARNRYKIKPQDCLSGTCQIHK